MAKNLIGEILVGTTSLKLVVSNVNTFKVIEKVHKDMRVGAEIYDSNTVPMELSESLITALQGFRQILADYGIVTRHIWASEMFMQADNAAYIADQILHATGFTIESLNSSQEVFYRNQALRMFYPQFATLAAASLQIIGISSGRLDIGYYANQAFKYSRSIALGPVRLAETLEEIQGQIVDYPQFLSDFIGSKIADFNRVLPITDPAKHLILVGSEVLNALFIKAGQTTATISLAQFEELKQQIFNNQTNQVLGEKYGLSEQVIKYALPEILVLERALNLAQVPKIILLDISVVDGLVFADAGKNSIGDTEIITAAQDIADQYRVANNHRQQVEHFALHLFDQLKAVHHLTQRDYLLLDVVCLVHDIGSFVNSHAHYLHSENLIKNIDFYGLSDNETAIIAAVARYHSSQIPVNEHYILKNFNAPERLLIAKLTALLRLADALDDSRQQKIKKIAVSIKKDKVIITAHTNHNILLENWVFKQKAQFFQDVFGMLPILKKRVNRK